MASGERITVPYARTATQTPLLLDVYAYAPAVDPADPSPTFAGHHQRLPFILFLHGGHFLTGSRRDVPPWLASLARSMGVPLLCADYRLAPQAGPSHAWTDVAALWRFIAEELNWVIAASGNGADVESGSEPLDRGFSELQRRGGIDVTKGTIVGAGAGGFLAATGGALLSPAPLAVVLGYPLLEIADPTSQSPYTVPDNLPTRLNALLDTRHIGNAAHAKSDVPDMPLLLQRSPYALEVRARSGMDMREPWRGQEESARRSGAVGMLLQAGCFNALLCAASPGLIDPTDLVAMGDGDFERTAGSSAAPMQRHRNRPYPPTLVFHGLQDTRVPPASSLRFLEAVRRSEPAAAAFDAFASETFASSRRGFGRTESDARPSRRQRSSDKRGNDDAGSSEDAARTSVATSPLRSCPANPNHTARYLFVGIEGHNAGQGFDALLPRTLSTTPAPSMGVPSHRGPTIMSDRYRASMIHVERFIRHWMHEGSAALAAAQNRALQQQRRHDAAGGNIRTPSSENDRTASRHAQGGARIRVPARGPRL